MVDRLNLSTIGPTEAGLVPRQKTDAAIVALNALSNQVADALVALGLDLDAAQKLANALSARIDALETGPIASYYEDHTALQALTALVYSVNTATNTHIGQLLPLLGQMARSTELRVQEGWLQGRRFGADAWSDLVPLAALRIRAEGRPGDAPDDYTSTLAGGFAADLPRLATSLVAVGDNGRVVRLAGTGTVALRRRVPIEVGRVRKVRWAVRRRANAADPANDTVRLGLAWFDQSYNRLSSGTWTVDLDTLTTASGRVVVQKTVALSGGAGIDVVAPAGACYFTLFAQAFGSGHLTDIEVLTETDVTDAQTWAPDVSAFAAALGALQSLQVGSRLDVIEGQVASPALLTFKTATDAAGATIPSVIARFRVLGHAAIGDGGAAEYNRTTGDPGPLGLQSADGSYWRLDLAGRVILGEQIGLKPYDAGAAAANSLALKVAMAALAALGGGVIRLRDGAFFVAEAVDNIYSGVIVEGVCTDVLHIGGDVPYQTTILPTGNFPVLRHRTRYASEVGVGALPGPKNVGGGFRFMTVDGNGQSDTLLAVDTVDNGTYHLTLRSPNGGRAALFDCGVQGRDVADNGCIQGMSCHLKVDCTGTPAARTAHCVVFRQTFASGVANANVSINDDIWLDMLHCDGHALMIEDGDNNVIRHRSYRVPGGQGLAVYGKGRRGGTGTSYCRANTFKYFGANAPSFVEDKLTPGVDVQASCDFKIDDENNTPIPVGAGVTYKTVSGLSQGYAEIRARIGADIYSALQARARGTGSEALRLFSGDGNHAVLDDGTSVWTLGIDPATGRMRILRAGSDDRGLLVGQSLESTGAIKATEIDLATGQKIYSDAGRLVIRLGTDPNYSYFSIDTEGKISPTKVAFPGGGLLYELGDDLVLRVGDGSGAKFFTFRKADGKIVTGSGVTLG